MAEQRDTAESCCVGSSAFVSDRLAPSPGVHSCSCDSVDAKQDTNSFGKLQPSSAVVRVNSRMIHRKGTANAAELVRITSQAAVATTSFVQARRRIQARLGQAHASGIVDGCELHRALSILGLERYTQDDIQLLLVRLHFALEAKPSSSVGMLTGSIKKSKKVLLSMLARSQSNLTVDQDAPLSIETFTEVLLMEDDLGRKLYKLRREDEVMLLDIKDVLLSKDTNLFVAELTNIRVNELSIPPTKVDISTAAEPFVGLVILLNGAAIGLQTDPMIEEWSAWPWIETCFMLFFVFEMFCRIRSHGARVHFLGEVGQDFQRSAAQGAIADGQGSCGRHADTVLGCRAAALCPLRAGCLPHSDDRQSDCGERLGAKF